MHHFQFPFLRPANIIPVVYYHRTPFYFHDVKFYEHTISTLITDQPLVVEWWISQTQHVHIKHIPDRRVIVGFDVEWLRPRINGHRQNPIATIQICVGHRCLVFQIYNSVDIPFALKQFLGNNKYTFVGMGIRSHAGSLRFDYGLQLGGKIVDIRKLSAQVFQMNRLKGAGLNQLAQLILGQNYEKPRLVTDGRWDSPRLTIQQVEYATKDAFVAYEIGRRLQAYYYHN